MLRFPVHPRLARLIIEGERLHVADDAARLAALLSERDIRPHARATIGASGLKKRTGQIAASDALELLDAFSEAENARFGSRQLPAADLDRNSVDRVRRASQQLSRFLARPRRTEENISEARESLQISLLAAFPDRVAKRRDRGTRDLVLSVGGAARLSEASVVHEATLLVAVDIEERHDQAASRAGGETLVRIASAIEEEWLVALFPDRIVQEVELRWNARASRVDESRRTYYDQIVLEETVQPAQPSAEVADMLAQAALSRNLNCFPDYSGIAELKVRLAILAHHFPDDGIPVLDQAALHQMIRDICDRKRSFSELTRVSLQEHFLERLTHRQKDLLRRRVPDAISLGSRRNLKVHYEEGNPPWVESRLQDFFRVKNTPTICEGRIALTVRLLAPNRRPVQITQDMAGFWQRHYPALRRELQRRYPKHPWPNPEEI
jgi:ATP-dependent helicase HrpB